MIDINKTKLNEENRKKSGKYDYESELHLSWLRWQEESLFNCINYALKKEQWKITLKGNLISSYIVVTLLSELLCCTKYRVKCFAFLDI